MFLKIASQIFPLYLFLDAAFFRGEISASQTFGFLSFYIAIGPVFYFMLNGVVGSKKKTVFGMEGREIGPFAGIQIPKKVVIIMLASISLCWLLAAIFYRYGI